ncbi:AMP-binding protein [Roseiterribacter gracilis]|uniref:Acetyl-CoA synthetase n=1 Tax=Roseiterribacter gracilis TaxID=2812848 RepID=A0A8S8XE40_9PROT|nr:acetyl-CoA synthetase [Rhodospirillales bacterium TMPK1]
MIADRYVLDGLPPPSAQPDFLFDRPELQYPAQLNAAAELLGHTPADRVLFHTPARRWTYGEIDALSSRIARVLVEAGLVTGGRVLLRGRTTAMLAACWFGVLKAGGVVVATMPLLRNRELSVIADKARADLALCEEDLRSELDGVCKTILTFTAEGDGNAELDRRARDVPGGFATVATAADDPALLAFTSGTTGAPKATVHLHRDILAIADCFPRSILNVQPDDLFLSSAPLAFTFGLGAHVIFPARYGAASILLPSAAPELLGDAIATMNPTILMTAPTAYRALLKHARRADWTSLRACVSAGEHLPVATFDAWLEATGHSLIDGIGATEMLHIFISAAPGKIRRGATGLAVPGYVATILDDDGNELPPDTPGRLAVRGPTGCRYLDDARQANYVANGWNITGDTYHRDADGYFWYHGRSDDMIVASGYNIGGPEVEEALLLHPAVRECAVVGSPDGERGMVVKAFVCLADDRPRDEALVRELQDFVKATIAPFKYPRRIEFLDALPRNESGKLQRFVLRDRERRAS